MHHRNTQVDFDAHLCSSCRLTLDQIRYSVLEKGESLPPVEQSAAAPANSLLSALIAVCACLLLLVLA